MCRLLGSLLILAIVLFAGRAVNAQAAAALVPAYIFPLSSSTWQPLYDQITAHPKVFFNVIVNPQSGPGDEAFPDVNYQREIKKLHTYANVRAVGYVSTRYTKRPITEVKADIDKYAAWQTQSPEIYVDGIFFDEAPAVADQTNVTYMKNIVAYGKAKKGSGLGKNADVYVITNPGQSKLPAAYLKESPQPDLVLVFEETYTKWKTGIDGNRQAIWDLDADNNQLAVMLHDVPASLTCAQITSLVNDLKGNVGVGSIWLTDLKGDASYLDWPNAPQFGKYISSLENGGKACV